MTTSTRDKTPEAILAPAPPLTLPATVSVPPEQVLPTIKEILLEKDRFLEDAPSELSE